MKKFFLFSCLVYLYFNLSAQDTTRSAIFKGMIITENDSTKLSGVHVINTSTLKGVVSGTTGEFVISVGHNDRILFSYLGFQIDTIRIDSSKHFHKVFLQVMKETSYMLSIFEALSIETFDEFKKEFLALDLPDEQLEFNFPTPQYQPNLPENQPFTIAIPFDLSYFSKKSKDYRRYMAMLEKDTYRNLIQQRYNEEVVEKVTGFKDKEKIKDLMEYCNFSDQFILHSLDYDLYVAIIKCSRTYEKKKKASE